MAGLEVLYASAAPVITCAQDALVCFLHWEVVTHGYSVVGAGDQVRRGGVGAPATRARAPALLSLPECRALDPRQTYRLGVHLSQSSPDPPQLQKGPSVPA